MIQDSDITIIGAGIAGLSTAYYLQKLGYHVRVIDRVQSLGNQAQASAINCGIMCSGAHAGNPLGRRLMDASLAVAAEMGEKARFIRSGALELFMTPEECQWGKDLEQTMRGQGLTEEDVLYLTGDQARSIEPNLGRNVMGALEFRQSGHVNPGRMTKTMGAMAREAGADIVLSQSVIAIDYLMKEGKYLIKTSCAAQVFQSRTIVLATGAQTASLGAQLGLNIPVVPVRGAMWSTAPLPKNFISRALFGGESHKYFSDTKNTQKLIANGHPPDTTHASETATAGWTRHLYGKQTHDGCMIFGGDRRISTLDAVPDVAANYLHLDTNKNHATELVPKLGEQLIRRSWTGLMPFSADGYPIIGKVSCLPGSAYIITGMSSAGMMQGPGAGLYLANLINGCRDAKEKLSLADPDRIITPLRRPVSGPRVQMARM